MSIDVIRLWSVLGKQIKSSLSFILNESDETVVEMMTPMAVAGIQDFALLKGKDRWDIDDIDPYIAAFWENIEFPHLVRLRDKITKAMMQELKQILQERSNSS
jgi:hypothetical protein